MSVALDAGLPAVAKHPDGIVDTVALTSTPLTDVVTGIIQTHYSIVIG